MDLWIGVKDRVARCGKGNRVGAALLAERAIRGQGTGRGANIRPAEFGLPIVCAYEGSGSPGR